MEEAQAVLARLERIATLDRTGARAPELLDELRALLDEAEAWTRAEGGDAGERAVDDLRSALARDSAQVQNVHAHVPDARNGPEGGGFAAAGVAAP
jgi:hypothetical protein